MKSYPYLNRCLPHGLLTILSVSLLVPLLAGAQTTPLDTQSNLAIQSDTVAPEVTLTNPDGIVISGPWTVLSATSTDNVGVVGIEFKYQRVGDYPLVTIAKVTTQASGAYSTTFDATKLADQAFYAIYAVSRDASGNRATSTSNVQINGLFRPGAYGDTPIRRTTQFVRPNDGVQIMLFSIYGFRNGLYDYLPYLTKEVDYFWVGIDPTPRPTRDYAADSLQKFSYEKLWSAIAALYALNPAQKVGVYMGHPSHLGPWEVAYPALVESDFLHGPSGSRLFPTRDRERPFINTANPKTRQKLVNFWKKILVANPGLDSLFLDGYKTFNNDPALKNIVCQEGPCNTRAFWESPITALSAALPGEIIYNGMVYNTPTPSNYPHSRMPDSPNTFNEGWMPWTDGAIEEWAHEIYISPEIFKQYIEVNSSIAAEGKVVQFYVQSQHLEKARIGWTDADNNLALEQFYLASYLLFERNPYTYFQYNPGTYYRNSHGTYYYENWNYDYGTPRGAYSVSADGLYSRNFAHGISVVNPTSAPLVFQLPVGERYRVWKPNSSTVAFGKVVIPAKTGMFYFGAPGIDDTNPPTVSITAPANNATVYGTTVLSASASDTVGVTSIVFKDGATALGSVTAAPYTFSWDTTKAPDGSHAVSVIARDAAGNVGTSSIRVMVSNTAHPLTRWTGGNVTLTQSGNVWNMIETATATTHQIAAKPAGINSSQTLTLSFLAKRVGAARDVYAFVENTQNTGNTSYIRYTLSGAGTATGKQGASSSNFSASISAQGGGWYRCSITVKPDSLGDTSIRFLMRLSIGTDGSYTGDGVSGIQFKDAKVEILSAQAADPNGSYPASAIAAFQSSISTLTLLFTRQMSGPTTLLRQ